MAAHPPDIGSASAAGAGSSGMLLSHNNNGTASTSRIPPPPSSPSSPTIRLPSGRSNVQKRERRFSRNSRPPHSADGSERPPPLPVMGAGHMHSSGSGNSQRDERHSMLGSGSSGSMSAGSAFIHSPRRASPPRDARSGSQPFGQEVSFGGADSPPASSPLRSSRILAASPNVDEQPFAGSPSSPPLQRSPNNMLALPLFVDSDRTRVSSSPMPPADQSQMLQINDDVDGPRISRAHSMRESSATGVQDEQRTWHLPSHRHETIGRADRRMASPSASMSLLVTEGSPRQHSRHNTESSWAALNARRWSSSLPRGRESAAFAFRLAEGASPYLRAGLEELRSIFDVDSNPIPASPFVDDERDPMNDSYDVLQREKQKRRFEEGASPGGASDAESSSLSRASSMLSSTVDGPSTRAMTASPAALSSRDISPSRGSLSLRRSPSDEERTEKSPSGSVDSNALGVSPPSTSGLYAAKPSFGSRLLRPTLHHRGESGLGDFRPPVIDRRLLAWSLSVIAVGMIVLCAWGYAMQSDTFSITLIGFFLTQPAFALAALFALLMRRRAWMDLFSRAMRAHVLAQAMIVVLAYLDLSASSFYVASSAQAHSDGGSLSRSVRRRFSMVPSMEMRFGPLHRATEAGDGPGVDLLHRATSSIISAARHQDTASDLDGSSLHAHDSAVGDWRSRLTHFVVFLVQAAVPIIMLLIGQYVVAQRLAVLARQGTLSRQSSLRDPVSSGSTKSSGCCSPGGKSQGSLPPPYVPGTSLATHQPLSIGTQRPVPRLHVQPCAHAPESSPRIVPRLNLPCGDGCTVVHPRHRREERRQRLVTAPAPTLEAVSSSGGEQAQQPLSSSPITAHDRRRMHRHHRSASHPVHLVDIGNSEAPMAGGPPTALGMLFRKEEPLFASPI